MFKALALPSPQEPFSRQGTCTESGRCLAEFSARCRQFAETDDPSDVVMLVLQRHFQTVVAEMRLGPDDDELDTEEFSIGLDDLAGDPRELYSYQNLSELSKDYAVHNGIENALVVKLKGAAAAESVGDFQGRDEDLSAYQNQVRAQSDKTKWLDQSLALHVG